MKKHIVFLMALSLLSCKQDVHQEPTHNFTVQRLIILNDVEEMLMVKVASNWYTPSLVYSDRQFIKESLDSLSNAYGIKTSTPQLHGQFSYKYEYHPHATLRGFFVARYVSGDILIPEDHEDVAWMPIEEAIAITPVESMKEIKRQIIDFPNTVWGGSYLVYREGEEHKARMVEEFYPLFTAGN